MSKKDPPDLALEPTVAHTPVPATAVDSPALGDAPTVIQPSSAPRMIVEGAGGELAAPPPASGVDFAGR